MFIGNMYDKFFDEFCSRDSLNNKQIIFMTVVMKGNVFAVIVINARGSDNRSA